MESNEVTFHQQGAVQRGDVTIPDKNFWVSLECSKIKQRKQARCAVAAAKAENRPHFFVCEHLHQVVGAFAVRPGKKPPPFAKISSQLSLETERRQSGNRILDTGGVRRGASRSNDTNGLPVLQMLRLEGHLTDQKPVSLATNAEQLFLGLGECVFQLFEDCRSSARG